MKARLWFVHKGIERLFQERRPADGGRARRADLRRHRRRPQPRLLPRRRGRRRRARPRPRRRSSVRSCSSSNVSTTTSPTSARWATTSGSGSRTPTRCGSASNCCGSTPASPATGSCAAASSPVAPASPGCPTPPRWREIRDDMHQVVDIMMANTTVVDRFTGTAVLSRDDAEQIGALGYVARASGLDVDARRDHPFADLYEKLAIPLLTDGDVMSRFRIRVAEIDSSVDLVIELLQRVQPGRLPRAARPPRRPPPRRRPRRRMARHHRPPRRDRHARHPARASRSSTRRSSTGRRCRSRSPATRSCPTSRSPTRASTSPTPATTCERQDAVGAVAGQLPMFGNGTGEV